MAQKVKEYDFVEHPNHYNGHELPVKIKGTDEKTIGIYETIDLIESELNRRASILKPDEIHSLGDAIKYIDRMGEKPEDGKSIREKFKEDALKTAWYLTRLANLIEKNGYES